MRVYIFTLTILITIISTTVFQNNVYAIDYATFDSFYKESISTKTWVIGGLLAVGGIALAVTGIGSAPGAAALGTAIGKIMGLSGAAATKAGLALLGGGALAKGGFGMLGGTVVLTTIFEGTMLGGSQIYEARTHQNNYNELCEQVKDYPNLPPIVNDSGPDEIEKVVDLFKKHYNFNALPSAKENVDTIHVALTALNRYEPEKDAFYKIGYDSVIRHEQLRVQTLKAILCFMDNDYKFAYKTALNAKQFYKSESDDGKKSVLLFIQSIAGLMANEIDIDTSLKYFRYAIMEEPDSPMLPLLYSIYISRAGALDVVTIDFINELYSIGSHIHKEKIKTVVNSQILTAAISKIWEEKNKIVYLLDNYDNLDREKAKVMIKHSYKNFNSFLEFAKAVKTFGIRYNDDTKEFWDKANDSINNYRNDSKELEKRIDEFEKHSDNQINS